MSKLLFYSLCLQMCVAGVLLASGGHAQQKKLNEVFLEVPSTENVRLKGLFKIVEKQTDFRFAYNAKALDLSQTIELSGGERSLYDVLSDVSRNASLQFKRVNQSIYVNQNAQETPAVEDVSKENVREVVVSGKVTSNEDNQPVPGVNIIEKGTTNGTTTDFDGNYRLEVTDGATLVFSYIGFVSQEIMVGSQSTINVVLEADLAQLEEVVVIGYGTQQKKDLTGSIATVSQDEYKHQPVNRVDQILQGRTAGVNVTNSSGAPGGTARIRIRGANSINGSNEPLYVVDGFVGAAFQDVNPSDIESIQVLKDASSTAIYGSRGANGVVLITTKSGKAGKPKLSLTARYITSEILDTWDLLDAPTFAETVNTRAATLGLNQPFSAADISSFRQNGGTDWQDELLRTGVGQEYQVDYSGGSDEVTYFISANYLDQEGIIINSDFKRYSIRTNLKASLSDKLTANLKLNFARRENRNTNGGGNTSGALAGALAWAPTTPARDENGILTLRDPISSIKGNPIELALNSNILESNTFNANGGFNYEIIEGLSADISFGASYVNEQEKGFSLGSLSNNPTARRLSRERIFLQSTNSLNYRKVFNSVHSFSATAVVEHQYRQIDQFNGGTSALLFPGLEYNAINLGDVATGSELEEQTIRSYIGRVNYSYNDKYLLTAAIRSDGSSKFRGDNRFSTFPSVALGWRISEESFMQGLAFLDDMKLRGSYGVTGNQGIDVFGTVTTFNTRDQNAATSFENGTITPGIIIGDPGNANIKWETTTQFNVGLDLSIISNRVNFTADYFEKNTEDLLLSEPLPQYAGGGSIFRNVGEVSNTGFEFSLTGVIIDQADFNWTSSLNMSFLTNEVTSIGDREQIFADGDAGAGLTNLPEMVLRPGESLATFYGLKYLGVWQQGEESEAAVYGRVPGDSKFEDLDGDGVIGGNDYQPIGNGIPTQLLGFNNTVTYKNFTLNVFFQGMFGYDKWNFTYAQAVMPVADARESTHADILNRWTPSNTGSDIPAFSESDVPEIQTSRFVESGDFLRLKNLSLTYNLPEDLIPGINGSLMISGNNLLTITDYRGIDPESFSNRGNAGEAQGADAGSYPNARTWIFGINVVF